MKTRMHLKITGRVQGVGYRAWAQRKAQSLGLKGWVKNCADGSVELECQGSPPQIAQFIQDCQQGPSAAQVLQVKKNPLPILSSEEDTNFEIRF